MNRSSAMRTLLAISIVAVMLAATTANAQSRPNVLFIAIDDLRPELGAYASPQAKTPHIDQLASSGMVFDRAYCQVAVCGASRASLMTSILPTPKRFVSYKTHADKEAPGVATLPQVFRQAGYTTLTNGKIFHAKGDTQDRSWSEPDWRPKVGGLTALDPKTTEKLSTRKRGRFYEAPDVPDDAYGDGQLAKKTIEDLHRLKKDGKPFFLACGFIRPHLPFYAPKKYWDLYDHDKIQIADNRYRPKDAPPDLRGSGEFRNYHLGDFEEGSVEFHKMMRHGYLASTSYVDKLVGDVLAELDRLELADDTIIVLWGDHGWHLGEHDFWGKHNTTHLSARVPLIVRVPGKKAGRTSAIVETIDLFPTLCALGGVDVPNTVQGKSLVPVLDQPDQAFREAAYCRYGPGDAVITERYTYTRYLRSNNEMLYDLKNDPGENRNVAGDPDYATTLNRMRELLKRRMAEASSAKIKSAKP